MTEAIQQRSELSCSALADSDARRDLPTPLQHSLVEAIPESRAITLHQDNAGSLPSGSLCEIEEGVLALGIKMILAGLGTGKKWDRVSLESNSSERGGWGECLWAALCCRMGPGGGKVALRPASPARAPAAVGGFSPKLPRDSKLQPHLCLNMKRTQEKSSAGRFGAEKIRGIF